MILMTLTKEAEWVKYLGKQQAFIHNHWHGRFMGTLGSNGFGAGTRVCCLLWFDCCGLSWDACRYFSRHVVILTVDLINRNGKCLELSKQIPDWWIKCLTALSRWQTEATLDCKQRKTLLDFKGPDLRAMCWLETLVLSVTWNNGNQTQNFVQPGAPFIRKATSAAQPTSRSLRF